MAKKSESADPGKLSRKKYEKELRKLQGQLCMLQDWVKHKGLRRQRLVSPLSASGAP